VAVIPFPAHAQAYDRSYGTPGGIVLAFPRQRGTFTIGMRSMLIRFASRRPSLLPIVFSIDSRGAETCRLAERLWITWDRHHGFMVTDAETGFTDQAPYRGAVALCTLIASLDE